MITKEEEKKIFYDNYKKIDSLIELRTKQIQDHEEGNWWPVLIEDETYKFLIGKLVELRQNATEQWGIDWVKQFPRGIYEEVVPKT